MTVLELNKNFRALYEKTRQSGSTKLIVDACNGPPHGAVIMANAKCLENWKPEAGVATLVSLFDNHAYLSIGKGRPVTIDLFAVDCMVAEALHYEGEMNEKVAELEHLLNDYRHRLTTIEDRRAQDKNEIASLRDVLANLLRSEFKKAEEYNSRHIIHKAKEVLEQTSRRD